MALPVPTYGQRWPELKRLWNLATLQPSPQVQKDLDRFTVRALRNKSRYQKIEAVTGVPWDMIAALHERESGMDFNTQLAQGWPLNSKSHWKPYTGPYKSWEDSAVAALTPPDKRFDLIRDWRLEKILFYAERYNGWGYYRYTPIRSPYVWAGTTVQQRGKYTSDGHYSSSVWDTQLGVAAMLKALMAKDPTIIHKRETTPEEDKALANAIGEVAVARVPDVVAQPVEVVPLQRSPSAQVDEPQVKPDRLPKSRTIWGGILTAAAGAMSTMLSNVNWPLAIVLLVAIGVGAWMVYSGRVNVQKVVDRLREELGQ